MINSKVLAYAISKGFAHVVSNGVDLLQYSFSKFNGTIAYGLFGDGRLISNITFKANVNGTNYSLLVTFKCHEAPFFTDKDWQREMFTRLHQTVITKDAEFINAFGSEFHMSIA